MRVTDFTCSSVPSATILDFHFVANTTQHNTTMPPAKKRKTVAKAKGKKKDHVVTATASSPPPAEKRPPEAEAKPEPGAEPVEEAQIVPEVPEEQPATTPSVASEPQQAEAPQPPEHETENEPPSPAPSAAPSTTITDRMARFRALQTRAKSSSASNLNAAQTEAHRLANDPSQLAAIQRRSAVAGHKLLKADIEDAGGDFERKRAWDWTVDESERWDERQARKGARRDNNAFQDYRQEAGKVYERQVANLGDPNLEKYTADKMRAIEAAASRGSLEIVETEDGEMVAVDKDGTFYGGGGGKGDLISSFADNKPDKKAVDRLVGEMRKAEDVAAKKRRERAARNGDDADVTYINDKNSKFNFTVSSMCSCECCMLTNAFLEQFNQKLSRFYNKYTAEIRDSFERGTMI